MHCSAKLQFFFRILAHSTTRVHFISDQTSICSSSLVMGRHRVPENLRNRLKHKLNQDLLHFLPNLCDKISQHILKKSSKLAKRRCQVIDWVGILSAVKRSCGMFMKEKVFMEA